MPEVLWDEELEWGATAGVTNNIGMSSCFMTPKYPNPGHVEMDFRHKGNLTEYELLKIIKKRLNQIFMGYTQFKTEDVEHLSFQSFLDIKDGTLKNGSERIYGSFDITPIIIDKFVLLISDRVTKIGCAASNHEKIFHFECITDGVLSGRDKVYERSGDAASYCSTFNWRYSCLCGPKRRKPILILKSQRKIKIHAHRKGRTSSLRSEIYLVICGLLLIY